MQKNQLNVTFGACKLEDVTDVAYAKVEIDTDKAVLEEFAKTKPSKPFGDFAVKDTDFLTDAAQIQSQAPYIRAYLFLKFMSLVNDRKVTRPELLQFLQAVINGGFIPSFPLNESTHQYLGLLCSGSGTVVKEGSVVSIVDALGESYSFPGVTDKEFAVLKKSSTVLNSYVALAITSLWNLKTATKVAFAFNAEASALPKDLLESSVTDTGNSNKGAKEVLADLKTLLENSKSLGKKKEVIPSLYFTPQLLGRTFDSIHRVRNIAFFEANSEDKFKETGGNAESLFFSLSEALESLLTQSTSLLRNVESRVNHVITTTGIDVTGLSQGPSNIFAKKEDVSNEIDLYSFEGVRRAGERLIEIADAWNKATELELMVAASTLIKKQQQMQKSVKKEEDPKKQKKMPKLPLGKGNQGIFDDILASGLALEINDENFSSFSARYGVGSKSALELFEDAVASKNMERRRPKLAKGTRDYDPEQQTIREKAINTITNVFKQHGAVSIDTPVFELKETLTGKYGEDSKLIYDLSDQGGELLSLRYDLTVPFARYVALKNLASIKRFHIAKVYRRDQPQMNKGRYREFYQCDFDIAGPSGTMVAESEVLKVVCEILTQVGVGEFAVKINDRVLLDAMIEIAGIDSSMFKSVCSSIDKLDKEPWEKVRKELVVDKGVTEEAADIISKFVVLNGECWEMYEKLTKDGLFNESAKGKEALEKMKVLFGYLDALEITPRIRFDLSLARGLDYYTGLIYEAVTLDPDFKVGSIGGGGRYDGLVGMFSGKDIPAVGASIGIERVFTILEEKAKKAGKVRPTSTVVLVASVGKGMVAEKFKMCNELWKAGIAAETLYQDNPKPQKQLDYAFESGIPYIIWLGEDEIAGGEFKLKDIEKKEENTFKRETLIDT
eukprot:CAMPEP_0115040514 /NCGR_PEP_ID=MMETSP0216-20121206/44865_1 /TAXON_ID=223996 /ORGANISM="Protocruzia adherens, Strain Boccale" /LENGTH=896 /DNA_ID=CAMNT_0002421751 /DNA_START=185 /DNA_END=2871 /DNA_ORIENTATION=+